MKAFIKKTILLSSAGLMLLGFSGCGGALLLEIIDTNATPFLQGDTAVYSAQKVNLDGTIEDVTGTVTWSSFDTIVALNPAVDLSSGTAIAWTIGDTVGTTDITAEDLVNNLSATVTLIVE